jgi:hypothetical protein
VVAANANVERAMVKAFPGVGRRIIFRAKALAAEEGLLPE